MPSEVPMVGRDQSVEELRRELAEAREQQAATTKILSVISCSPGTPTPVFDTILRSARELCAAKFGHLLLFNGDTWRAAALHNVPKPYAEWWNREAVVAGPETNLGRVQRTGRPDQVADVRVGTGYIARTPLGIATVELGGARTLLSVPLLKDSAVIGAISLYRAEVRPFDDRQVELLQTFADQAVIAIENTRLFEEVQSRTRELQESLKYQTATSDVLGVISRSPNQPQPVLDAIVTTAFGLCPSDRATIMLRTAEHHRFVAGAGFTPDEMNYRLQQGPIPIDRGSVSGRVALEGRTIHVQDVQSDPNYKHWPEVFAHDRRTVLGVPLVRDGIIAGVIILVRSKVEPYNQRQIELVETFADQAVIAMNNARLFEEVQARTRELTESLEYQTATSEVLSVISRSPSDLQPVLDAIVKTAVRLCQADFADFRLLSDGLYRIAATTADEAMHVRTLRDNPIVPGRGSVVGRAALERGTVHVPDIQADPEYTYVPGPHFPVMRTLLGVPLVRDGVAIGVIVLFNRTVKPFTQKQMALVTTFADQALIAIENTRLFEEVQARTRELARTVEELEIASQHKSQFVANMSHELRTPLAAVLGYAELLQEGIYGALPEKSLPILTRIRSNGNHLLGLINTVLDISKIEAGQFKLNLAEYALGNIVETVMVATESLAATKKLAFKTDVAKELPYGLGDEQRLTQVLLNLVGNAIKFTDAGEVRITAGAANGHFELSVSDTGPGIPPEECEHIFEKFRQVDSSNTRAKGGTGLGLAIAREIVQMHGGRIWVESRQGQGSTFRMELPVHAPIAAGAE
jgi:signal transduction histidine kinase